MIVNVRMLAFEDSVNDAIKMRQVEIPDEQWNVTKDKLGLVFYYGQNDFQPQNCCSVSVGDVVELDDKLVLCLGCGWKEIDEETYNEYVKVPRQDRTMWAYKYETN